MNLIDLTPKQLRNIADIKEKIIELNAELTELAGNSNSAQPPVQVKRPMSAAIRHKISLAQKRAWRVGRKVRK